MNDSDLLRRVCDAVQGYLKVGVESFEADGALFVRGRDIPSRYDANHVGLFRVETEEEVERLLARAEAEFAHIEYRRFDIDPLTPPRLEARLSLDGYTLSTGLGHLLEGELNAVARPHVIREVLTDDDWRSYRQLWRLDITEFEERRNSARVREIIEHEEDDFIDYIRGKSPTVRTWLAVMDGIDVGYFSSWPGDNGIGQVEDLFVRREYRHRGIATALIAHCVADARARGAGPVIISSAIDDTPKHMYAAMGFRPFYVSKTWIKRLDASS